MRTHPFVVLLAEDSEDDIHAIRRCWSEVDPQCIVQSVKDGRECMDYLRRMSQDGHSDGAHPEDTPPVDLLLLDLAMPELSGFQVLTRIKQTPALKRLPVVILANNPSPEEVRRGYELGASAVFHKPSGIRKLTELLKILAAFWNSASLPDGATSVLDGSPRKDQHIA